MGEHECEVSNISDVSVERGSSGDSTAAWDAESSDDSASGGAPTDVVEEGLLTQFLMDTFGNTTDDTTINDLIQL